VQPFAELASNFRARRQSRMICRFAMAASLPS
jgi:hypothetical protein